MEIATALISVEIATAQISVEMARFQHTIQSVQCTVTDIYMYIRASYRGGEGGGTGIPQSYIPLTLNVQKVFGKNVGSFVFWFS